jgi:hypothetical protein
LGFVEEINFVEIGELSKVVFDVAFAVKILISLEEAWILLENIEEGGGMKERVGGVFNESED